jgi:hypothetical protein
MDNLVYLIPKEIILWDFHNTVCVIMIIMTHDDNEKYSKNIHSQRRLKFIILLIKCRRIHSSVFIEMYATTLCRHTPNFSVTEEEKSNRVWKVTDILARSSFVIRFFIISISHNHAYSFRVYR